MGSHKEWEHIRNIGSEEVQVLREEWGGGMTNGEYRISKPRGKGVSPEGLMDQSVFGLEKRVFTPEG